MYYVHALICPINKRPSYIGKGCGDRMYHHLRNLDRYNEEKNQYDLECSQRDTSQAALLAK